MNLSLSNRLLTCCSFVHQGDVVADVGCDHGYLGLWLLSNGIASSVIASDVNELPLESARSNALKFGFHDRIQFFLSDGVQNIPHDFDSMVCAGMGADTMIGIIRSAPWLKNEHYRLILQCQSKRPELRKYLNRNGFTITRETLAQDGKFIYTVLEAVYAPQAQLEQWEYYVSEALLASHSALLPAFLDRVIHGLEDSLKGLRISDYESALQLEAVIDRLKTERSCAANDNCSDNT